MATRDGGFELGKWYNETSAKLESSSSDNTDVEDAEVVSAPKVPVGEVTVCYVCRVLNPEYLSTDQVKKVPVVPVCGKECEAEYLRQKGVNADTKNGGKYVQLTVSHSDTADSRPSKKAKREEEVQTIPKATASAYPKRSFRYLDDHMLGDDSGKGYKSWWLGALAFYDFVYQRHGMSYIYAMGPKTPRVDPILTQYWTCNIYRELDRSTAYLRKHVVRWQLAHQGKLSLRETLWMAVVFRYCNKLETFYKSDGIPISDTFDVFQKRLRNLAKSKDSPALFAGRRELDVNRYLEVLDEFLEHLDEIAGSVKSSMSASQVFDELRKFADNALGSFTCWQVVCDLMEFNLFPDYFQKDDFVWLSVDAQKSLVQIFGKNRARPSEYVSLAKLLEQRQIQGFKDLKVRFPFFLGQKLSLKNIGHALHGFQVYRNMKLLDRKQFDKREPGTTQPVAYLSRSTLQDSEVCEKCGVSYGEDDDLLMCDMCNGMFHPDCIQTKELPPAWWVCEACTKLANLPDQGIVAQQEVISIE